MKKYILNLSIIALMVSVLFSTGCTDSFGEVNTDPDRTTDAPLTNILAYTIRYTGSTLFDPWSDMNEPSTYGEHLTKIQYIDESRYEFRPGVVENKWYYIYLNYSNIKEVEQRAHAEGLVNMESVSKVWGTMLMQIATDTWRDCPYTDAAKMSDGILLPTYDKQEDIYPAMLDVLASAAEGFASGATDALGEGDILFGGNIKKWQQYCNSMRLRLALRISKVDPSRAKAVVEQIMGNQEKYPIISANADNAFFWWPGSAPYIEPWMSDSQNRDDHAISDVCINLLKSLEDPRLPVYAHPAVSDGEYRGGIVGGKSVDPNLASISRIGSRFRDDPAGFTAYYRAAESYFHLAEAAKLGWNVGMTTQEAYEKAVTLSLEENEIPVAEITTYLEGKAKFNDTFDQIYEQEWIALFKQGMEGWSLLRRTGIPSTAYVAPGSPYVGHNSVPFRYPYPGNETALNGANVAPFIAEVVDDFWGKQMWWDTRTGVQ